MSHRERGARFFDHAGNKLDKFGRLDNEADYDVDAFAMVFTFGSIAPGASPTQSPLVPGDADFYWEETAAYFETNGAAATSTQLADLLIQIADGGSGRPLYQSALPVSMVTGSSTNGPYRLRRPRLFSRSSQINVTLTNNTAAGKGPGQLTYDNVFIAMLGLKIWPAGKKHEERHPRERFDRYGR